MCGVMLTRRPKEKRRDFFARKYCTNACRYQSVSAQRVAQWRQPDIRARVIRGIRLSKNTVESLQRARQQMLANHQSPQYIATRRSRRRLTREQVQAIMRDTRASRRVARDYGVSKTTIARILAGKYYADFTRSD